MHYDQGGGTPEEIRLQLKYAGEYRVGPFHRMVRRFATKRIAQLKWRKKTYREKWHAVPLVATYYRRSKSGTEYIRRPPITKETPMGYSSEPPRDN